MGLTISRSIREFHGERLSAILRYGMAALSVAAALTIAWWMESVFQSAAHVSLLLCAVMLTAWFGGLKPALLAVMLAVLGFDYFFLAPIYSLNVDIKELARLVLFVLAAFFVGSLTAAQRRAAQSLGQARDDLQGALHDLKTINRALQTENAERKRAEEALRKSEERYRDLVDLSPDAIYLVDSQSHLVSANPAGLDLLGCTAQEAAGRAVVETYLPEERAVHRARLEKLKAGTGLRFDRTFVRKDGARVPVEVSTSPMHHGYSQVVMRDISERKQAEKEQRQAKAALENAFAEIKHSEDQLRAIIDTIPTLAWRSRADGSAEFFNQRWLDYTGLVTAQVLGWGWTVALHPDDGAEAIEKWRAILASGTAGEHEARLRRYDGEYRWFLFRAVPLRDEHGMIIKWYGSNTDIEDLKQAEEIRAVHARQAAVRADVSAALSKPAHLGQILRGCAQAIVRHLDAAFARIWILNPERNMLELQASAGMYTHLDGPHSRIPVGKLKIGLIALEKKPHFTDDVRNDPRVSDKAWAQNEGMISFAGYPLIVQDRVIGVMAMFARQRLSPATLDTFAAVADAIAQGIERARTEEALQKAQAELAHVARVTTLGELTASIAHEVNQPLSAIVANGNACVRWLAAAEPNLDEAREAARRIIRDGNRASGVINRIRALIRKADAEKAPLDINDAIQEVAALAQSEVRRNNVALRTELAHDLPRVTGDRVQLQQVILNLVMNGIEAMASIGDRPRELLIYSCRQADSVLVAVRDAGPGIDSQDFEKIFDTFYTTKAHGMGMGLAISRSIVENHGGRLWASRNDGPGATFQFTVMTCD